MSEPNPNIRLVGGDENLLTARNLEVSVGRNISPDDVELGRAVVVLGNDIVQRLTVRIY